MNTRNAQKLESKGQKLGYGTHDYWWRRYDGEYNVIPAVVVGRTVRGKIIVEFIDGTRANVNAESVRERVPLLADDLRGCP